MQSKYPKPRPQYFAVKFMAQLLNSDLVSQLNPRTLLLLNFVVIREDQLHYKRPPSFWANELMNRLGITKNTLMEIRKEAIQAGLLCYVKGSRKVQAKYWVLDPDWMGFPKPQSSVSSTLNPSQSSVSSTEHSTEHSTLTKPNTQYPNKERVVSSKRFDPLKVKIPDSLKNESFEIAWSEWVQHRVEMKKPMTKLQTTKQLKQLEGWGVTRSIAAIENSIANGWKNLIEPDRKKSTVEEQPYYKDLSGTGLIE